MTATSRFAWTFIFPATAAAHAGHTEQISTVELALLLCALAGVAVARLWMLVYGAKVLSGAWRVSWIFWCLATLALFCLTFLVFLFGDSYGPDWGLAAVGAVVLLFEYGFVRAAQSDAADRRRKR